MKILKVTEMKLIFTLFDFNLFVIVAKLDINSSNKKIEQKVKTKEAAKLQQRLLEPFSSTPPPPPLENLADAVHLTHNQNNNINSSLYSFIHEPNQNQRNRKQQSAITTIRVVNKTDENDNQVTILY